MPSQLEPEDIVERLKLCLTRRKLTADVDAALRDAISEIERLRYETEYRQQKMTRSEARKATKRERGGAS
jgi:hypothetical protein